MIDRFRVIIAVAVGVAFVGAAAPFLFSTVDQRTVWRAGLALHHRQFAEADRLAGDVLERQPKNFAAAIIQGDALSGLHEYERAVAAYDRVPDDAGGWSVLARAGRGQRWFEMGELERAESDFRFVLDQHPEHFWANRRYAFLMQLQGRIQESIAPSMRMIRMGKFGAREVHIVGAGAGRFLVDERRLDRWQERTPDSTGPILAEARLAQLTEDVASAEQTFRRLVDEGSSVVEPYVQLGRIYLDSGRPADFLTLNSRLPAAADTHPEVWLNRGIWARGEERDRLAIHCFTRALTLAPHHREATYLLSQVLRSTGRNELAQTIGERARVLARIELSIPEFYSEPTPERVRPIAEDLASIGRYWEAAAMADFTRRFERSPPAWASELLTEYAHELYRTDGSLVPYPIIEQLSELDLPPFPDWKTLGTEERSLQNQESPIPELRFANRADETQLRFQYFNGSDTDRRINHIFRTVGGGVAAIDFDRDSWPDLFFTQGTQLAGIVDGTGSPSDALFRNRSGTAENVTAAAGIVETDRFGQGAAVGDIDGDGFPDLFVCNHLGNRLYLNNGDGTFTEATERAGVAGQEWSLSAAFADLDGDGHPDLYVVNYLQYSEAKARECGRNGVPLTCTPTVLPAEQDRLYLNNGDGTFREVTNTSGIVRSEGKGLAVLAGDLDDSGRISIFVGNDTAPDFLFTNEADPGQPPRFLENGVLSGLAFDGSGASQATMGIAFGDPDHSGTFDLFVTDFIGTSNTLFSQEVAGLFNDVSRSRGLREPSIEKLAFGTEFLDADLDGNLDLFVTNGHVDRSEATGEPDRMSPQLFYGSERGTFREVPQSKIGEYFTDEYFGRSVARLDWNRDGRDDLCILHLFDPVALLINETPRTGNFLRLHLRGRSGDRDAIGTKVVVECGGKTTIHQIVSGDGYMTSNERQLTIGLGDSKVVDKLTVRWMSGKSQVLENLTANREYVIREGNPDALPLSR